MKGALDVMDLTNKMTEGHWTFDVILMYCRNNHRSRIREHLREVQ